MKHPEMKQLQSQAGLEGNLRALEFRDGAPGFVETTAVTTEASATSTASTASTATATTATTAEAAALTIAGTGGAEVQAQGTTLKLLSLELGVSLASLLNRRVLDVAKALGAARLGVGGQTDTQDASLLGENITESILGGTERQVANKEGVTLRAGLVTIVASTSLSTVTALLLLGLASSSVVQVDGTAINLGTLLGLHGLGSISRVGVLNVAKT